MNFAAGVLLVVMQHGETAPEAAEDSLDSAAGVPPETDTFAPPKSDVSRTLRLRDSVWVRQAMDDLVAAEFALRLELEESQQDEEESFVDFARLREQLDSRLVELESGAGKSKIAARDRAALRSRARDTAAALADAEAAAAARRSSEHVEEVVEEEEDKQFWRELGVPSCCGAFHVTRGHLTMPRVVYFSSLRPFGPSLSTQARTARRIKT